VEEDFDLPVDAGVRGGIFLALAGKFAEPFRYAAKAVGLERISRPTPR